MQTKREISCSTSYISLGSKGEEVKQLQNNLIKLGYVCGSCGADGDYGPATESAVKSFQGKNGLAQDGCFGPDTKKALKEALDSYEANKVENGGTTTPVTPPINDPGNNSNLELGVLSAKYESGDPGSVSNNQGDPGGKSYGAWQLASKEGSVDSFLSWLKGVNSNYYQELITAKQNDGNTFGSNFDACWKQIAQSDKSGFYNIQHDYIKNAYYDVAAHALMDKYGFNINTKSFALQNVLWSTAVQHGAYSAASIFNKAGLTGGDEQIINGVYDERQKVDIYFNRCSENVKKAVYNRFVSERQDALNMLKSEQVKVKTNNTITLQPDNQQNQLPSNNNTRGYIIDDPKPKTYVS